MCKWNTTNLQGANSTCKPTKSTNLQNFHSTQNQLTTQKTIFFVYYPISLPKNVCQRYIGRVKHSAR